MKRKSIKQKVKNFFTKFPEGNIWKRITIYLIILRFISPLALIFMMPLLIGLVSPGQDMDFSNVSLSLAESFEDILDSMYNLGSEIAVNNPIVAKVLFFGIANTVWVIYFGMLYLLIDVIRHLTSWIYSRRPSITKQSSNRKHTKLNQSLAK